MTAETFGFASAMLFIAATASADPLAFVTDQGADALAIVDLAQGRVVETVKIGKKPAGVAVAPGGARIFASNPEGRSVSFIERQADGTYKAVAELRVGEGPLGLALDAKGEKLFVADWYTSLVHVVDVEKREVTGTITVGKSPSGMVASPDGQWLYVANRESDTLSAVNLATMKSEMEIPVGKAPFGVSYDTNGPEGPRLLIANVQSADVSVVDPVARRETGRLKVRAFPYAVAVTKDGSRIFVTNQHDDSVSVFDGKSFRELGVIPACGYPEGILISPDQREALVACWMDDLLVAIDVESLKVTRKIAVGASPRAFGQFIAPDAK
jgi:YVTN family beta-propeller protein